MRGNHGPPPSSNDDMLPLKEEGLLAIFGRGLAIRGGIRHNPPVRTRIPPT
ncbi:hypothetical protein I35_6379 [Burkholderia cenocepacia H111]|nr:hypothetical protein I35_6379 [Burkholderia cenocepacia H111]